MLSLMALTPSSWEQQPRVGSRIRRQLCFDDSGSCSSKPSGGALGRSAVLGCLLLLFCAGCLVPTSYFTALRLPWGRGQGAPAAAQLTARGARWLIQTSDPAADTWLGEEWEQQRQLVTERQQQQEQQQGGLPGTGGINSAAVAEQAELQRGPPVPLAHNLSASVPREAVLGLYNQQLHTLLQHTPQLLRWVEPRARHRFCFPCIKGPGAQVGGRAGERLKLALSVARAGWQQLPEPAGAIAASWSALLKADPPPSHSVLHCAAGGAGGQRPALSRAAGAHSPG